MLPALAFRDHCRFIAAQDLFRGTIDSATVHPREVVKEALKHNAAKVILAHVHPSGGAEPSKADEYITDRVKQALALVDIKVPRPRGRRRDHEFCAEGDDLRGLDMAPRTPIVCIDAASAYRNLNNMWQS